MKTAKFNPSQILLISTESWDGHFVSKHHYAITLTVKGHKVYFLNPIGAIFLNREWINSMLQLLNKKTPQHQI